MALPACTCSPSFLHSLGTRFLSIVQLKWYRFWNEKARCLCHDLQFVDILSQNKVRERLRSARENFAAKFPLTEQLWLAWIADTLDEVAQDIVPPDSLLQLAERALNDYLSVSLWQQYLTYGPLLRPQQL